MNFGRAVRDRWLLQEGVTFLNHGSFGAAPRSVLDAQTELRTRLERTPVRFMEWARTEGVRAAVGRCAPFLGAHPGDLVFVDNATTGVAAVLGSLQLAPGDVLLATDHGYGAVTLAMRHAVARAGASIEIVPVPFPVEHPSQVVEAVRSALHDRVRLVILDWITAPTGLVFPIEELVRVCRSHGLPVLVDGAHVPGHVPCDLERLGADYFVGNAHKWLFAPKGTAFLYARPERQADLHPPVISWGYGEGWLAEFDWLGTRDPTNWLAAPVGLDFLQELGFDAVRRYDTTLRADAAALLRDAWGTAPLAPDAMLGNLCTIDLPFRTSADPALAKRLNETLYQRHQIEVPFFAWRDRCWLRISAQVYNTLDDYQRLADAIGPDGIR